MTMKPTNKNNNDNDNDKPFSTRPFIGQDYIFLIFELGFG